jgi:hypothetical protein
MKRVIRSKVQYLKNQETQFLINQILKNKIEKKINYTRGFKKK